MLNEHLSHTFLCECYLFMCELFCRYSKHPQNHLNTRTAAAVAHIGTNIGAIEMSYDLDVH